MKYTVHFTSTASTSVTLEAGDPEEAIDKAYEELHVFVCHQCAEEFDIAGEWEPYVVDDENGREVWSEG